MEQNLRDEMKMNNLNPISTRAELRVQCNLWGVGKKNETECVFQLNIIVLVFVGSRNIFQNVLKRDNKSRVRIRMYDECTWHEKV